MVRPYAKGLKRKKREEHVDSEQEEEEEEVPLQGQDKQNPDDPVIDLPGIPIYPVDQKPSSKPGVVFVLEKASLEVAKVGKKYQLLNSDDHGNFLKKHKLDRALYRPDIVHQALLAILDSPLNKAGRLKALYVQTEKNVLIQVNPHIRLPRTFKRFCGVMMQLLQKLSIRATDGPDKLLRVIKNPVTQYFPVNSRKIGLSYSAPKVVPLRDYLPASSDDVNLVFAVGAMAHGKISADYVDEFVSVSGYPLSAACCIGRICNTLEQKWGII